jgi:hypothetical protein
MARKIVETNDPRLSQIEIHGELTHEDMTCDSELGLGRGKPMWVLLDVTHMSVALPEDFLDASRKSWFMNPDLQHMAVYTRSSLLAGVASMIAKLTRRKDKLSVHTSHDAAIAHLHGLMDEHR